MLGIKSLVIRIKYHTIGIKKHVLRIKNLVLKSFGNILFYDGKCAYNTFFY
jgi:hypothetical protein